LFLSSFRDPLFLTIPRKPLCPLFLSGLPHSFGFSLLCVILMERLSAAVRDFPPDFAGYLTAPLQTPWDGVLLKTSPFLHAPFRCRSVALMMSRDFIQDYLAGYSYGPSGAYFSLRSSAGFFRQLLRVPHIGISFEFAKVFRTFPQTFPPDSVFWDWPRSIRSRVLYKPSPQKVRRFSRSFLHLMIARAEVLAPHIVDA